MKTKTKSSAPGKSTQKTDQTLSYPLTYRDVVDILKIIDASGRGELQVELEDLKLTVVKK